MTSRAGDVPLPRIEAAGGVLWRPRDGGGVEVALVHRPAYDDWSLPKGKLDPGEHPLLAAVREVREETGFRGVPGRPLGEVHYRKNGLPKRVRYWALRVAAGAFAANPEVDEIAWLTPAEGLRRLPAERDRPVLAAFAADPAPTWPVLVAGLPPLGAPAALVAVYEVQRLAPDGSAQVPPAPLDEAAAALVALAGERRPVLVCSARPDPPALVGALRARLGDPAATPPASGAGLWVVHLGDGPTGPRVVAVERLDGAGTPAPAVR